MKLDEDTQEWMAAFATAIFIVGLAIFTLLGAGFCNYARFYDVHACTFGGVK
jgi:hypothetical protein